MNAILRSFAAVRVKLSPTQSWLMPRKPPNGTFGRSQVTPEMAKFRGAEFDAQLRIVPPTNVASLATARWD